MKYDKIASMIILLFFSLHIMLSGLAPHSYLDNPSLEQAEKALLAKAQETIMQETAFLEASNYIEKYLHIAEEDLELLESYRQKEVKKFLKRLRTEPHFLVQVLQRYQLPQQIAEQKTFLENPAILNILVKKKVEEIDRSSLHIKLLEILPPDDSEVHIKVLYQRLLVDPIKSSGQDEEYNHATAVLRALLPPALFFSEIQESIQSGKIQEVLTIITHFGIQYLPARSIINYWNQNTSENSHEESFFNHLEKLLNENPSLMLNTPQENYLLFRQAIEFSIHISEEETIYYHKDQYPALTKVILLKSNHKGIESLLSYFSIDRAMPTMLKVCGTEVFKRVNLLCLLKVCSKMNPAQGDQFYRELNSNEQLEDFPVKICGPYSESNTLDTIEFLWQKGYTKLAEHIKSQYFQYFLTQDLTYFNGLVKFVKICNEYCSHISMEFLVSIYQKDPNSVKRLLEYMIETSQFPSVTTKFILESPILEQLDDSNSPFQKILEAMILKGDLHTLQESLLQSSFKEITSKESGYNRLAWILSILIQQNKYQYELTLKLHLAKISLDTLTTKVKALPGTIKFQAFIFVEALKSEEAQENISQVLFFISLRYPQQLEKYLIKLVQEYPKRRAKTSQEKFSEEEITAQVIALWITVKEPILLLWKDFFKDKKNNTYIASMLLQYKLYKSLEEIYQQIDPPPLLFRCVYQTLWTQPIKEEDRKTRQWLEKMCRSKDRFPTLVITEQDLRKHYQTLSEFNHAFAALNVQVQISHIHLEYHNPTTIQIQVGHEVKEFSDPLWKQITQLLTQRNITVTTGATLSNPKPCTVLAVTNQVMKSHSSHEDPLHQMAQGMLTQWIHQQEISPQNVQLLPQVIKPQKISLDPSIPLSLEKIFFILTTLCPLNYLTPKNQNILHHLAQLDQCIEPNIIGLLQQKCTSQQIIKTMINQKDCYGMTPLMYAVRNTDIFAQFLQFHPEETTDNTGLSLEDYILLWGNQELIILWHKHHQEPNSESEHISIQDSCKSLCRRIHFRIYQYESFKDYSKFLMRKLRHPDTHPPDFIPPDSHKILYLKEKGSAWEELLEEETKHAWEVFETILQESSSPSTEGSREINLEHLYEDQALSDTKHRMIRIQKLQALSVLKHAFKLQVQNASLKIQKKIILDIIHSQDNLRLVYLFLTAAFEQKQNHAEWLLFFKQYQGIVWALYTYLTKWPITDPERYNRITPVLQPLKESCPPGLFANCIAQDQSLSRIPILLEYLGTKHISLQKFFESWGDDTKNHVSFLVQNYKKIPEEIAQCFIKAPIDVQIRVLQSTKKHPELFCKLVRMVAVTLSKLTHLKDIKSSLYQYLYKWPTEEPNRYKAFSIDADALRKEFPRDFFWEQILSDILENEHAIGIHFIPLIKIVELWLADKATYSTIMLKLNQVLQEEKTVLKQWHPPSPTITLRNKISSEMVVHLLQIYHEYPYFVEYILNTHRIGKITLKTLSNECFCTFIHVLESEQIANISPVTIWVRCQDLYSSQQQQVYNKLQECVEQQSLKFKIDHSTTRKLDDLKSWVQLGKSHPHLAQALMKSLFPEVYVITEITSKNIPIFIQFLEIFPQTIKKIPVYILHQIYEKSGLEETDYFEQFLKIVQNNPCTPLITYQQLLNYTSEIILWFVKYPQYRIILFKMISTKSTNKEEEFQNFLKKNHGQKANFQPIIFILLVMSQEQDLPYDIIIQIYQSEIDYSQLIAQCQDPPFQYHHGDCDKVQLLMKQLLPFKEVDSIDSLVHTLIQENNLQRLKNLIWGSAQEYRLLEKYNFSKGSVPPACNRFKDQVIVKILLEYSASGWDKLQDILEDWNTPGYLCNILLEYDHLPKARALLSHIPPRAKILDLGYLYRLMKDESRKPRIKAWLQSLKSSSDIQTFSFRVHHFPKKSNVNIAKIIQKVQKIIPISTIYTQDQELLLLAMLRNVTQEIHAIEEPTSLIDQLTSQEETEYQEEHEELLIQLYRTTLKSSSIPQERMIPRHIPNPQDKESPIACILKQIHSKSKLSRICSEIYPQLKELFPLLYQDELGQNIFHHLAQISSTVEPDIKQLLTQRYSQSQIEHYLNHPDYLGMTPLMYAVNNPHFFKQLLLMEPQTGCTDSRGWSIVHHLLLRGSRDCIIMYLNHIMEVDIGSSEELPYRDCSVVILYKKLLEIISQFSSPVPFWKQALVIKNLTIMFKDSTMYQIFPNEEEFHERFSIWKEWYLDPPQESLDLSSCSLFPINKTTPLKKSYIARISA